MSNKSRHKWSLAVVCLVACLSAGCSGHKGPDAVKFDEADKLLAGKSKGTYHGNTERARIMAMQYSSSVEGFDEALFEGQNESGGLETGEDFLVYCREDNDTVVFLVRVPEMDRYQGDVRDLLLNLSWAVAEEACADHPNAENLQIAVGLRGMFVYSGSAIGKFGEAPTYQGASRINHETFYKYFAPSDGEATSDQKSDQKSDQSHDEVH
ncbi:MAG: hypothetical protein ACI9G1_002046 [Pirellulaceae bacterium]|jgi:hypothetical protein